VAGLGRLPLGMSLAAIGVLNGLPSETGVFNFTARVVDREGAEVERPFSLTVAPPSGPYDSQFVLQTVPTSLSVGQRFTVNMKWLNTGTKEWDPYLGFIVRSQNPASNTTWGSNVISATGVQPGQILNLTFSAVAPSIGGAYNFQWQLSQDGTSLFGETSANVSITVTDPNPPSVATPSSITGVQGSPFTLQLDAIGGTPPYAWSIASGTLPGGLNMTAAGSITGNPASQGDFPVTFKVTDAQARSAQKLITITVGPPALTIISGTIPAAQSGSAFSYQLAAAGGKPPYQWALTGGLLPGGLSLATGTGIISGTPSLAGTFNFTVDVTDSNSGSARKALAITVAPMQLTLNAAATLDGLKGTAFNYQPAVSGGTPPYSWSISAGSLPSGLTLNTTTGALTGTPSVSGIFGFTLAVRDQSSATASRPVQLRILDPDTIPQITKVKYKSGKKQLIVNGDRIDAAAKLWVDGTAQAAAPDGRQFKIKKLPLAPGAHEIKIVNPWDIPSLPFILNVAP
jgi:hypothetical protein